MLFLLTSGEYNNNIKGDSMETELNIQRMRTLMVSLYNDNGMNEVVLKISRKLDELIVKNIRSQLEFKNKEIIEKKNIGIAYKLLKVANRKNTYLKGHLLRVFLITLDITTEMGLSQKEVITITNAALLHDIGKIFIDNSILDKPGKLNRYERKIIYKHPEIGAIFIKSFINNPDILEIIKLHHEHIDGKGYPEKLTKEDIPFGSKIIAVADAFDAMTSSRPYRVKPMTSNMAFDILLENAGTQFDQAIVDKVLNLYRKKPSFKLY